MQIAPEHQQSIINWAEGLLKVTVVHLLGGRARGTAKPESDIELGLALGSADSWRDLLTYLNHRRAWRLKLEKVLGLRVRLELLNDERAADVPHLTTTREILWRRG